MADTNGYNSDRLDRIERIVEVLATTQADMANTQSEMQQDVKNLYRSQVVMGEALNKLAEAQRELAVAQKHADERMDALILTVDEIIRGRKRE
jgi:hypothetical protein